MDILKKKVIPQSFNKDILKAIDAITYNKKNIIFAGSFIRKSMRDNADIDISEDFKGSFIHTAKALQKIVSKILKNPEYIILDIKSGINPLFRHAFINSIGYIKNTKIIDYDYNGLIKDISLHQKFIDEDKLNELKKIMKKKPTLKEYFEISELLRKIITLRWTPQEVLKGYKYINGFKYSLANSVSSFITKIDMVFKNMSYYTEISNVFTVKNADDITFAPLTTNIKDYVYCIKYNLLEYLTNGYSLKTLKRIFSLAVAYKDNKTINEIVPIIVSNVGLLNKANSIIKTFIDIMDKYGNKYNDEIAKQLNNLKLLVSNIYQFNFNEKKLDRQLDEQPNIKLLESIAEELTNIINKNTNKLIEEINFKIPSKYIL